MSNDFQSSKINPSGKSADLDDTSANLDENDLWDLTDSEETINQKSSTSNGDSDESEVDIDTQRSETPKTNGLSVSLTKFEKISLISVVAIVSVSLALLILQFSNRITIKPDLGGRLDLPIKGKLITVTSVETFWRKPITEGDDHDIFRRGVKVIPVINIDFEASSGAIRILFRNDQGILIGDSISRSINGNGSMSIAATDGFDNPGIHAAYQTGESDRWTIHVLEGPSIKAPIEKFHTLLQTEISTELR